MTEARWRLPASARSVPDARRRVTRTLHEWGLDGLADAAALLTSELVTNAVLHARTDILVTVVREEHGARIAVSDGSPLAPAVRRHSTMATTGRGVQLLEQLADSWSTDLEGEGKTVWFRLSTGRDPWAGAHTSAGERRR